MDRPGVSDATLACVDASTWERLRTWAEAETGMDFSGPRFSRLQEAVRKVLGRRPANVSLGGLLAHPQEHGAFLERLTAELTVGESFFFRNEHHFRALREHVIPQILEENAQRREIRVWSAGCAGGEEPYSLAILLDQMLAARRDWRVSILATDLNPEFLERARNGCYRLWSFRHTEIHNDRRYFSQEGDTYRLAANAREHVRFAYLNLVKDVYPSPLTGTLGLDLILFRNVAIYLTAKVTAAIIARFHEALRPGGWLLLGETEVTLAPVAPFEVRRFEAATFYQKKRDSTITTGVPAHLPASPVLAPVTPAATATPPHAGVARPAPAPSKLSPALKRHDASAPANSGLLSERLQRCAAEGRFDEAEVALARTSDRKQRAQLRLRYAQALLACADTARARQSLEECLKEEPLLLEAHLLNASFAEEAGKLDAAEAAYRKALYVDRNCPMAHFHLALLQQQTGDHTGAARSLRTLLKLIEGKDPLAAVEYGEGVCYGRLKEMADVLLTT